MRLRNKYPRSQQWAWAWNQVAEWESKLGVYLHVDYEESESYLVRGLGEDLLYAANM